MTRWTVLGLLVLAGCASDVSHPELSPTYDADSGQLARLDFDSNRDGRPDIAATMEGPAVRVVEIDVDHDGQTDRWEYYEPAGDRAAGFEPQLARIEQVTRRGGVIVRREGYEAGELSWVHEDRDADGRVDRWETYTGGVLTTVELDTTGAGHATRRLRYQHDGVLVESPEHR